MSIAVRDLFCGAGGSSIGAEMAGARLSHGLNHWRRAIETHATNFQHADHDCADVSALTTSEIRRYPIADILIASPECTNHSLAKGARRRKPKAGSLFDDGPAGDDEQDRSRATMWDVVRFVDMQILKGHPYKAVIVENVTDAYRWGEDDNGLLFQAWLQAMGALGYEHEIVWLNSMFAPPTPQSRDRMYVVFWRRGMRAPNLRVEPPSWCPSCEHIVDGRQSFKLSKAKRPVGKRYGAQYVYTCPSCGSVVLPGAFPAATAIDWALPAERIGDRRRPLATATRERIRRGLERLSREPFAIRLLQGGAPRPLTLPLVTLTQRLDVGMVLPVAGNTFERTPGNRARRADRQPADTVHGTLDRALIVPGTTLVTRTGHKSAGRLRGQDPAVDPTLAATTQGDIALVMARTQNEVPRPAARGPVFAQTTNRSPALVLSNRAHNVPRKADAEPTHPVLTGQHFGVVHLRQNQTVTPVTEPVGTVSAGGGHHGVVVANYSPGWAKHADEAPVGTVTASDHHSLVLPYRKGSGRSAGHPAPTVATKDCLALVVPAGGSWRREASDAMEPAPTQTATESFGLAWTDDDIDDCRFRMFELDEIARTMVMAHHVDGGVYVVTGNKRERMAQYGNAVTPPAMRLLVERVLEVL
jgi:DNA (cytosine-5)-methyltransferase 1